MHFPIFKNWENHTKRKSLEASSLPAFLCFKNCLQSRLLFQYVIMNQAMVHWLCRSYFLFFFVFTDSLGVSYTPILLTSSYLHNFLSLLQFTPTKNLIKETNQNKTSKQKANKNKAKKKNPLHFFLVALAATGHHIVYSFVQSAFEQMFIAMSHWSGARPLVSGTASSLDLHQNSFAIPRGCPESWRHCKYRSRRPVLSPAPTGPRWGRF